MKSLEFSVSRNDASESLQPEVDARSMIATLVDQLCGSSDVDTSARVSDVIGDKFAALSDDDIKLDRIERALLALERNGKISPAYADHLHLMYLGAK